MLNACCHRRLFPPDASTVEKIRGRVETREVHCVRVDAETFGFPFAAQLALVRRHRHYLSDGHEAEGFVYALTSRDAGRASPADLLGFSRGHWGIETRVHYMRDANYHEDRCRIANGNAAHVCASLRTLAGWLLGKKSDGNRRNTRRRQHVRLTQNAGKAVRLIVNPDP